MLIESGDIGNKFVSLCDTNNFDILQKYFY